MSWWSGFADQIEPDAPIGTMTWFRLGGRARHLFRPRNAEQLAAFVARARDEEAPYKVLGSGANVLVRDDGFDGVVIRLDQPAFRRIERNGPTLTVGAGVDLIPLARRCSNRGLTGLECMADIPATVGGAIRMNAGGKFGDVSKVVRDIIVLETDCSIRSVPADKVGFGYRHTQLKERIVLSARFDLSEGDPQKVRERFRECTEFKRRTQPLKEKSAGCIFKNPVGQSAGALIDRAGLKGTSYGGARVSDRHANFIVAEEGATAGDVLHLIDIVREQVHREFRTELEMEIDVW